MDAKDLSVLIQKIVSVLLAFGIGVFWLVKPALFIRGSWKTKTFVLITVRICGLIMIGFGIALILKYLGILF